MCGRMTQTTDPAEVARIFDAESTSCTDADHAKPVQRRARAAPDGGAATGRARPAGGAGSLGAGAVVRHLVEGWRQAHHPGRVTVVTSRSSARHFGSGAASCRVMASTGGAGPVGPSSRTSFIRPRMRAGHAGVWAVWKIPRPGCGFISAGHYHDANRMMSSIHDACRCCCGVRRGRTAGPGIRRQRLPVFAARPAPDDVLGMYPIRPASTRAQRRGGLLEPIEADFHPRTVA